MNAHVTVADHRVRRQGQQHRWWAAKSICNDKGLSPPALTAQHRPVSMARSQSVDSGKIARPSVKLSSFVDTSTSTNRASPVNSLPSAEKSAAEQRLSRLTDAQIAELAALTAHERMRRRCQAVNSVIALYDSNIGTINLKSRSELSHDDGRENHGGLTSVRLSLMKTEQLSNLARDLETEARKREIPGVGAFGRAQRASASSLASSNDIISITLSPVKPSLNSMGRSLSAGTLGKSNSRGSTGWTLIKKRRQRRDVEVDVSSVDASITATVAGSPVHPTELVLTKINAIEEYAQYPEQTPLDAIQWPEPSGLWPSPNVHRFSFEDSFSKYKDDVAFCDTSGNISSVPGPLNHIDWHARLEGLPHDAFLSLSRVVASEAQARSLQSHSRDSMTLSFVSQFSVNTETDKIGGSAGISTEMQNDLEEALVNIPDDDLRDLCKIIEEIQNFRKTHLAEREPPRQEQRFNDSRRVYKRQAVLPRGDTVGKDFRVAAYDEAERSTSVSKRLAKMEANRLAWSRRISNYTDLQVLEVMKDMVDEIRRRSLVAAGAAIGEENLFLPAQGYFSTKRNAARRELAYMRSADLRTMWAVVREIIEERGLKMPI